MITEQEALQNLQLRFDEVNALEYLVETGTFWEYSKEDAKRNFEECLFWFFVDGYSSGILMLDEDGLIEQMPNGYEFLDIRYGDGETVLEKFNKYYDAKDVERMKNLMDSESHRMYSTGGMKAATDVKKAEEFKEVTDKGEIIKKWHGWLDGKERDTHLELEGVEKGLDEDFVSSSGDYGQAPGLFQTAEENANCRCWLSFGRRKQ